MYDTRACKFYIRRVLNNEYQRVRDHKTEVPLIEILLYTFFSFSFAIPCDGHLTGNRRFWDFESLLLTAYEIRAAVGDR